MAQDRNSYRYGKGDLIAEVAEIEPFDAKERRDIEATLQFLRADPHPFDRTNFAGHVTGSGFLLSPDRRSVLLTHHAALGRWLQFGGHADGEALVRNVAIRETQEESGKQDVRLLSARIFEVDVHEIPASSKRNEPPHLHYDVRYVLQAQNLDFQVSAESKELRWVPLEEILEYPAYDDLKRMAIKARRLVAAH